MEDSITFLLGTLKQLIMYHHDLISGADTELKELQEDLDELKVVLHEASKKLKKDDMFKKWERKVREVAYDVEDTINTCITQKAAKSKVKRLLGIGLAESVRKIKRDHVRPLLQSARAEFANLPDVDVPDAIVEVAREIRQKMTKNIVGFKEEADEFINFLTRESDKLEVASIVGMAGLGKTTLAWKIFEDPRIKYEFPVKIWVNISDLLNMKNVLTILKMFTATPTKESEHDLKEEVKDKLKDRKFLLVIDDMWTSKQWVEIKDILPWNNKMGRVIITTRQSDVALLSVQASTIAPHYLRFLTAAESWELLQYEVYGELNVVPPELVVVGRVIATACDGLPLSIVVIGGILAEKNLSSKTVIAMKSEWSDVSTSLKPYLVDGDRKKLLASIISLSYEKLPYELKNCFLYLGVFPEDADIPVTKLSWLWIAEGFIQQSMGKSLERVAYENLKELINRNLVMVRKAKPDGEAKICYIHDSIREICKTEGRFDNLNLFQEISKAPEGFEPRENITKCRRLCNHSYVAEFFLEKTKLPKARSFLSLSKTPIFLDPKDMSSVTDGFSILGVYDAKNIKFPKFPQKLFQLLHLRYLTLVVTSDQFKILPKVISDLWNLQTFILDVSSPRLEMDVDIWKMRQLRHIKTKATIILKSDGRGEGGVNLQTLSRLAPESCTVEVFTKARNLITLGIQGDLNTLENCKCLENLAFLNKLKLVYKVSRGVASENPLQNLPDSQKFPSNLKILVVSGTYLEWWKMSTLSTLHSLEVLKLKENAFRGLSWEAVGGGFLNLVRLHIERAELITWTAKGDSFPELRYLYLSNCEKLQDIPSVFGEGKLELLCLERVTSLAVSCADAIEKEKLKTGTVFKLEVAHEDRNRRT